MGTSGWKVVMKNRSAVLDTDPETERLLTELARPTPVWKKFRQVGALNQMCRAFAKAGIRRRYPEANEEEVRRRLAAVLFDRETVVKVFGWDPDVEGY
jgi:hypothetical protein